MLKRAKKIIKEWYEEHKAAVFFSGFIAFLIIVLALEIFALYLFYKFGMLW